MAMVILPLALLPLCPGLGCGPCWLGDHFSNFPQFFICQEIIFQIPFLSCARNILSAWAVCGFWDWLMYLSPLAARCQVVKSRERILSSPGSNRSKSTQNFQLGRKCAMMPSGRQLVWSVPLFSRLPTVGESPMARYKPLPPLLKVPSLIWYETFSGIDGSMISFQGVDPVHDPPKRAP